MKKKNKKIFQLYYNRISPTACISYKATRDAGISIISSHASSRNTFTVYIVLAKEKKRGNNNNNKKMLRKLSNRHNAISRRCLVKRPSPIKLRYFLIGRCAGRWKGSSTVYNGEEKKKCRVLTLLMTACRRVYSLRKIESLFF